MDVRFGSNAVSRWAGIVAVALLLCMMGAKSGFAQELNAQTFLASPSLVLEQNPDGGPTLVGQIRDLAVADPGTLASIIGLLSGANKNQKAAIASGLAQAAKIVMRHNWRYAEKIKQAIDDTKDQDVILAYAGATGDLPNYSWGGVGGQTNPLPGPRSTAGSVEPIVGNNVPTGSIFNYTSSVGGASSTGTTIILTTSVSP